MAWVPHSRLGQDNDDNHDKEPIVTPKRRRKVEVVLPLRSKQSNEGNDNTPLMKNSKAKNKIIKGNQMPIHVVVSPSKSSQSQCTLSFSSSDSSQLSSSTGTCPFPQPKNEVECFLNHFSKLIAVFKKPDFKSKDFEKVLVPLLEAFDIPNIKDILKSCKRDPNASPVPCSKIFKLIKFPV